MSERSRQIRQVIGFFWPDDELAHTPGGFMSQLIRTICKADQMNQNLLSIPYPTVVAAVRDAQQKREGRMILASVVRHDEEGPL